MKYSSVLESYEERVARVASGIQDYARRTTSKVTPDVVRDLAHAHSHHELEGRLGGKAHAHLMKDAIKMARPDVSTANRSLGARARSQALKGFHSALASEINVAIGNAIPDGDPFDHLHDKAEDLADRHGVRDYDHYDLPDHLDKAARLNGYKHYHDQLASVWDDYHHDNPDYMGGGEHLLTYHRDDPDGKAKHDQLTKNAEAEGMTTRHSTYGDHVDVYKTSKFENPWR